MQKHADSFKETDIVVGEPTDFGIAFAKDNQALRDEVQKVMNEMKADGTIAKISENGLVKISLQNNKINKKRERKVLAFYFDNIVTAKIMMIAPINSNKPKEIFKKIIDKIIEEKGSKEAKTLIFVGERYFVLSR